MAPMVRISMPFAAGPHHSAVVKGLLKAALKDLATDALTRKPAFNPTVVMKHDPVFLSRFGEIAAEADAVFALADKCVALLEKCDREERDVSPAEGPRLTAAESFMHHKATSLMDQIMMLSGSAGVYMGNRQQRRWRDLRCVAQHQAANIGSFGAYAKALVAQAAAG
jgi:alkylation response protein AidB-like acyl-CoA dehydrogenase